MTREVSNTSYINKEKCIWGYVQNDMMRKDVSSRTSILSNRRVGYVALLFVTNFDDISSPRTFWGVPILVDNIDVV